MLTRRGFLATILGTTAAALVADAAPAGWLWTPTQTGPTIAPAALVSMDDVLAALAARIEALGQLHLVSLPNNPTQWAPFPQGARARRRNRPGGYAGGLRTVNIELPRTVGPEGLTESRAIDYAARDLYEELRRARYAVQLRRFENDIIEGAIVRPSGLTLRGMVYPEQDQFFLPPDRFVLRVDTLTIQG